MNNLPLHTIGLGGSCHWCTEAVFQSLNGVEKVEQGWIASEGSYDVFSEAVIVHYDPQIISLHDLIEIHLHTHSCTSNHSMRKKYRSAVYYFTEEQQSEATVILKYLQTDFSRPIITQILPYKSFTLNEAIWLNYYFSDIRKPFCENIINPKLQLLLARFSAKLNAQKLQHLLPQPSLA